MAQQRNVGKSLTCIHVAGAEDAASKQGCSAEVLDAKVEGSSLIATHVLII